MSRGGRQSGPLRCHCSVYERFGRRLANGIPEKESSDLGHFSGGAPKTCRTGERDAGPWLQVAVLAGVLGAAACAFSWARFSSHSAFFLARRSRLRRAVRGSCGLPMVGGCLAELLCRVALKSSGSRRKRAVPVPVPEIGRLFPIPDRTGARGLLRGDPKSCRERGGESGHGHVYGAEGENQFVGAACFSSKVAKRGAAPSTCFSAIPRSFS